MPSISFDDVELPIWFDWLECLVSEGVPKDGYRTYAPRGFVFWDKKHHRCAMWGMDNQNKPQVDFSMLKKSLKVT